MSERYNIPEKGTLDWHVPLNENFEKLDSHVEIRDAESNLDSYTPAKGAKYLATNTGRRYLGTGSNWTDAPLSVPTVQSDPSTPVNGQLWYNTSDGALRVSTASGTEDIWSSSSGGDESSTGSSDDSYFDGATLYSSEYSNLQDAVNSAQAKDRVLIDANHNLSDSVELKSDLLIRGDGGTITVAGGSNTDVLRPENVNNIWIDGVEIDGNRANNSGGRGIGGINLGNISNIRITNCNLYDFGNNAIELQEKQSGEYQDIYIADNTITNASNHGIVVGIKNHNSSLHDVVIEGNRVTGFETDQGIGCYGQQSYVDSVAIIGNYIERSPGYAGMCASFEERTRNCIIYGNEIYPNGSAGCGTSKDSENNITANNYIEGGGRSTLCAVWDYYTDNDYTHAYHLFAKNAIVDGNMGLFYTNCKGSIAYRDNQITNTSPTINDAGGNTAELGGYTFENNTTSVEGAGLPSSVGSSDSWSDGSGNTIGSASWDRGSIDPSSPVSVSVTTSI